LNDRNKLYTVSELAREFALTPQALRFYEEKGLLHPDRVGGARVFGYRDRVRLMLILKFRRLGFSLEEIRDYLARYRSGRPSAQQYRDGLRKVRNRLAEMERMRAEIDEVVAELKEMEQDALNRLAACDPSEDPEADPGRAP
jgi:DNA-binding transcriptional MerR regulator